MERLITRSFRTDDATKKRIDALAAREDRTVSKMLDILVREALQAREREAEKLEREQ